jgi:transcriptional regulator with XRE-family HTH domain
MTKRYDIKTFRERKGITLAQLAKEVGMKEPALFWAENGAGTNDRDISRIAKVLGVSPDDMEIRPGDFAVRRQRLVPSQLLFRQSATNEPVQQHAMRPRMSTAAFNPSPGRPVALSSPFVSSDDTRRAARNGLKATIAQIRRKCPPGDEADRQVRLAIDAFQQHAIYRQMSTAADGSAEHRRTPPKQPVQLTPSQQPVQPTPSKQTTEYHSCFISYSTKDQDFADRLHADLQNKGVRCWFAPHDMPIGGKIRVEIDTAIRQRDKVLLILSEHSIKSDWVEDEVEKGFAEERKRGQVVLFPVRLDDAVMETNEAWAVKLRDQRNMGDFRRWKDHDGYARSFERVLRDLKLSSEAGK